MLNLNQPAKRSRRPSVYQTFCKLWWNKKPPIGPILRDVVEKEWPVVYTSSDDYDPEVNTVIPPYPVTFINAMAKVVFFQQPEPFRNDIIKYHKSLKEIPVVEVDETADEAATEAIEFQQ